jgi:hypothetical protein
VLNIWTDVWANVYVDGKPLGVRAPVFGLKVPVGKRRITLENDKLGVKRSYTVRIRKNKESKITDRFRE